MTRCRIILICCTLLGFGTNVTPALTGKTSSNFDCDPGRVTIRRLNRAEYNNTIRDLVGIDFHPADDFPADDAGYGFDNIGDVLSVSPVLLEKYLVAAQRILSKAIVADTKANPTQHFDADTLQGTAPSDSL